MALDERDGYIHIDRKIYTQKEFDDVFGLIEKDRSTREHCSDICTTHCMCSALCVRRRMYKFVPLIDMIRTYKWKEYILADILSGLSVGIIHIPQGMGFALLTGVPAYYGLYSCFWPVLFYIIFGTCRHMSVGAMALISLFIGAVVEREIATYVDNHANGTTGESGIALTEDEIGNKRASIACAVSLLIGLIQIVLGLLKLGMVTCVMPTSFISGFTTGATVHIVTSQLKYMLGLTLKRHDGILKMPWTWYEIGKEIKDTNAAEVVITIVCIVVLYVLKEIINEKFKKKLPVPIPAELLVLIAATILSHFLHFSEEFNVKTIGAIPKGMPAPAVPPLQNASNYIVDAFIAAVLSFTLSAAMFNIFSRRHGYEVDANQEMFAYGISHTVSSFFWCFAGAAAPSRCFIQDTTGGKTQMASLFSCILLLLVIFFLGPLLESLPNSVLAAVIVVSIIPLYKQVRDVRRYWLLNKTDCAIWLVSFVSTVFLDISFGLVVGIAFSIFTIALRGCFAKAYTLGTKQNSGLYVSSRSYQKTHEFENVMVFKYESSLYFTTALHFKDQLQEAYEILLLSGYNKNLSAIQQNANRSNNDSATIKTNIEQPKATELNSIHQEPNGILNPMDTLEFSQMKNQLKAIVVDCSPINYIDIVGLDTIEQIHGDFKNIGIELVLAACNLPLLRKLYHKGLLGNEESKLKVYVSVHDAVSAYCDTNNETYVIDNDSCDIKL